MKKVYLVAILIICIIAFVPLKVQAGQVIGTDGTSGTGGTSSGTTGPNDEIYPNYWEPTVDSSDEFEDKINVIVSAIRNIGIVVSVIALMIIGIRTMTCSVEEKAVYKQALPGYILGVIMVIAITAIPTIIYEFAQKL